MYVMQQLTKNAPKILHSKVCFKAFCEANLKIGISVLISQNGTLTVALSGLRPYRKERRR